MKASEDKLTIYTIYLQEIELKKLRLMCTFKHQRCPWSPLIKLMSKDAVLKINIQMTELTVQNDQIKQMINLMFIRHI